MTSHLQILLMISLISSLTRGCVSGLSPNRGSPPALQRATTASLLLFTAARNRGEQLSMSNKFTSALCWIIIGMTCGLKEAAKWRADLCHESLAFGSEPASKSVLTTCGLCMAAQWRADLWSESLALGSEPASKSALTTGTELLYSAARWRAVN